MADEQPVLFADGGGPDGVLHGVVINGRLPMLEVTAEVCPMVQRVGAGFAQLAFRKGPVSQDFQYALKSEVGIECMLLTVGAYLFDGQSVVTDVCFDLVEPGDELEQPGRSREGCWSWAS